MKVFKDSRTATMRERLQLTRSLAALIIIFYFWSVNAHQGEKHQENEPPKPSSKSTPYNQEIIEEIADRYQQTVKPIFESSCFDCHGNASKLPWYFAVPGIKGLMKSDMIDAKKHLDMRKGFPFRGHGTLKEDLEAIKSSIKDSEMPPLRYKVMHWNAYLSGDDRNLIFAWVESSLEALND